MTDEQDQASGAGAILPVVLRALVVVTVAASMGGAVWYARHEASDGSSATINLSALKAAGAEAAKPVSPAATLPPHGKVLALFRATMLAIDHGMKTGNFTVVRDLGSVSFRKSNSAAKLGQIFESLGANQVDLLAAAIVDPQFTKAPALTPEKMLYLTGLLPIAPRAAAFEMLLELEDGEWRVFAVAIAPVTQ